MAVVVSDTSPLRALHHLGLVGLLAELFGEVYIPPAVASELLSPSSGLPPIRVEEFTSVRVVSPHNKTQMAELQLTLDAGESEALSLALELHASAILIDEEDGRAAARRMGLPVIGALGILLRGKQRGLIVEVSPLLNRLRRELGFFMSDALIQEVTRQAGE